MGYTPHPAFPCQYMFKDLDESILEHSISLSRRSTVALYALSSNPHDVQLRKCKHC